MLRTLHRNRTNWEIDLNFVRCNALFLVAASILAVSCGTNDSLDTQDISTVDIVETRAGVEVVDQNDEVSEVQADVLDIEVCTPDCDGKECGSDGCGGSCGECADGYLCNDEGICLPVCDLYRISFAGDLVQKIAYMDIGIGGHPGEALDVDNDPETCSPEDDCEGGFNNELSALQAEIGGWVDVSAELHAALEGGDMILLAESTGWNMDGDEFTTNFYLARPVAPLEECDIMAEKCDYLVDPGSFDLLGCTPIISFDNCVVTDGTFRAGGPDSLVSVSIPVVEGTMLTVTAYQAQIVATVNGEGADMTWEDGLIGGAIPKAKMTEAVDSLPPDVVEDLPISTGMLKNLLDMFITNDVDIDNDGEMDAASVGIKFGTIPGEIIGMEL